MDRKALAASKLDLLYAGTRDKTVRAQCGGCDSWPLTIRVVRPSVVHAVTPALRCCPR